MKKHFFILMIFALPILYACSGSTQAKSAYAGNQDELISSTKATVVNTVAGKVAGYIDNKIYIYKGIPYAKAERFMPPEQPDKWEGIRSSRAYGPTCPQEKRAGWYSDEQAFAFNWDDGFPDEDCLRLNIWTPGINDSSKRPVMVWLHGGGYSSGSGQELPSYDGTNLSRKGDVVVVSLNHRLNVLGFLDLSAYGEKYKSSGNAGLLDIVAALEWVKENINSFGGDPSNVTIFGQSGGGGKVSTLLATPNAKGLYHKAIIQSGAMLSTMESKWSRRIGIATVEELGLDASNVDQLQQVPYEKLLSAGNKAIAKVKVEAQKNGFSPFIFGWATTVDGHIVPQQPFDPQAPEQSRDIRILLGSTLHEFCASTYVPALRTITLEQAKEQVKQKYGNRSTEFLSAFEKAYPDYKPLDLIDTDFIFRIGAVEMANRKSIQGDTPVYMYLFTWESPSMDGIMRSTHCMDIPFVFNNVNLHSGMTGNGKSAIALAEKVSNAWISFARNGNPNTEGLPYWEPYNYENGITMFFDDNCVVKKNHDKELLNIVRQFPVRGF